MNWDPSPFIFSFSWFEWTRESFLSSFGLRWYSVLFIAGFLLAYWRFLKIAKEEGKALEPFENMLVVIFASAVIGARLGHCLFYDPDYYFANPLEILKIWKGGLASHGGTLGVLVGVYFWQKNHKEIGFWWLVDRICIFTPIAACFIRLGNFMNQEILGHATDKAWGIRFLSGDPLVRRGLEAIPRHPSQLYEAVSYLLIFFIMYLFYKTFRPIPKGSAFGLMFVLIFLSRFFIEYTKVRQAAFETGPFLNMGQYLSIPFVLAGLGLMYFAFKKRSPH